VENYPVTSQEITLAGRHGGYRVCTLFRAARGRIKVLSMGLGDPAEIKAKRVKKQKFGHEDARSCSG
jgi:hypothetical protein